MRRITIRRKAAPVSLFSFLDILGGTIGILTLIIAVFLIQMGQGKQIVQMVSEGKQYQDRIASYIICNGAGMVEIHVGQKPIITTADSSEVSKLLEDLRESKDRYLIFGVRPEGFADFDALRAKAEGMNIAVGYEPLDNGWRIRSPGGALL